jgi:hypothetical protein
MRCIFRTFAVFGQYLLQHQPERLDSVLRTPNPHALMTGREVGISPRPVVPDGAQRIQRCAIDASATRLRP